MAKPVIRESDVVRIIELMRERAVRQSELRQCEERAKLFGRHPLNIFLGQNLLVGDRVKIPFHIILEPLRQFLSDQIDERTQEIRNLGVSPDRERATIEADGLKVVPEPQVFRTPLSNRLRASHECR